MPREGFSGIRWGSLHWTLKNRHDMFKDSESGKGLQKGRKLGLGPEGDVDPGLKQGCDWAPTMVVGSKVGYTGGWWSFSQTPAEAICLQECGWRKQVGACEESHPAGEGFDLQRSRSRVTHTTAWQCSCLKIEETEIKSGWCEYPKDDLLKT